MKNRLIKQTLAATLAGVALFASAAHASHDGYYDRPPAHQDPYFREHAHRSDERHDASRAGRQSDRFEARIDDRQDRQKSRILTGKRSGELTRHEFRALMHEQRAIGAMKERFLSDGRLDPWEFRRLERALDTASRSIRAERHDHQARNHRDDRGPWYN